MIELSGIVLVGVILCGVILLGVLGMGLFNLLLQLGVIVRESRRPPHLDSGDYRIDQGREVRSEEQQR
jgi:hypothetical protein